MLSKDKVIFMKHENTDHHGETIDFFYLKDTLKSQAITVLFFSAAAIGVIIYSYISFWGIPASFNEFLELLAFSGMEKLRLAAVIAAILVMIYSVISYFTRKNCYVEFKETALCGKLPAFPLRAKYIEVPYDDIIGVKRAFTSRTGSFSAIIVITKCGRIFIPHESPTKIRKIENLLYELKDR